MGTPDGGSKASTTHAVPVPAPGLTRAQAEAAYSPRPTSCDREDNLTGKRELRSAESTSKEVAEYQANPHKSSTTRYDKLLEDSMKSLNILEAAVNAAPNTKTDVKNGVKNLTKSLRDFYKFAKEIGMTRPPDNTETQLRLIQKQHQQQHLQLLEMLKEAPSTSTSQTHEVTTKIDCGTDSALIDIAQEIKELRKEVRDIRSTQGHSGGYVDGGSWTEVVKKRPPAKELRAEQVVATQPSQSSGLAPDNQRVRSTRTRTRPLALVVDVGSNEDFPALAQKIKGMDSNTVGNTITGMRKTKNGGLLLEVRGDQSAVDLVRTEVSRTAGNVGVRLLQQRSMLEIRDIDVWSDRGVVADSIAREAKVPIDMVNVVGLRSVYGRSQTALVLLPTNHANSIVAGGRLKISVVSCRVRLAEKRKGRCYKCLAFDHEAKECKGADRTSSCRRCGNQGHYAKDCAAEALEADAFSNLLRKEALEHRAKNEVKQK